MGEYTQHLGWAAGSSWSSWTPCLKKVFLHHSCSTISNPWQKLWELPAIQKALRGHCHPESIAGGKSASQVRQSCKGWSALS